MNSRTIILAFCGILVGAMSIFAQGLKPEPIGEANRAKHAAEKALRLFHAHLDVGPIFDNLAGTAAETAIAQCKYTSSMVEGSFLCSQGPTVKRRVVRDELNFGYLLLLLQIRYLDGNEPKLPPHFLQEYNQQFATSRFLRPLGDGHGPTKDASKIQDSVELSGYLSELEAAGGLIRKYIPKDYYLNRTFIRNYKGFVSETGDRFAKPVVIEHGNSYYGIPDDVEVFRLSTEILQMRFIQQSGQMKLLAFVTE